MDLLLILTLIPIAVAIPIWWYIMKSTEPPPGLGDELSTEPVLDPDPDQPLSFGDRTIWLAIRAQDGKRVAEGLGLRQLQPANWKTGLACIHGNGDSTRRVFVTPPVNGWILVAGALPEPGDDLNDEEAMPFLKEVASHFPDVQYFGTHNLVDWHAWAVVKQGKLRRAYSYIGDLGLKNWDLGPKTRVEQELGLNFFDPDDPSADDDNYWSRPDLHYPTEENVLQLAAHWSINPGDLESMGLPPSRGLVGLLPEKWGERL